MTSSLVLRRTQLPLWLTRSPIASALLPGTPIAAWQLSRSAPPLHNTRTITQTVLHGTPVTNVKGFLTPNERTPRRSVFCATTTCPHVALSFSSAAAIEGLHTGLDAGAMLGVLGETFGVPVVPDTEGCLQDAWTCGRVEPPSRPIALTAVIVMGCDLRDTHFEPEGPELNDAEYGCTWTGMDAATAARPICFPYDGAMAYSVPWDRIIEVQAVLLGTSRLTDS